MADTEKLCKIINNGSTDVIVLIPSTTDAPDSPSSIKLYNQSLKQLKLASGKNSIAKNTNDTVTLNEQYKDPKTGELKPSVVYDLLVSTTDWALPVANRGVIKIPPTVPFADQTITADDLAAMQNAAKFHQEISAQPESKLATDYQDAMSKITAAASTQADGSANSSENVANSITGGVDDFFKATKTYKNVTLAHVVTVESYYKKFPFVWAEYKDTVTYYLYSNNGTVTSFVGTVELKKSGAIDLSKENGGYTCTFTPASDPSDTTKVEVDSSQAKSLSYADELFVDDLTKDIPEISLKGVFHLKSRFSQKPTDTQIISVLTGSVNGQTVLGVDFPQNSNDPDSEFWDTLFHPKNSREYFQSFMEIGGALMMLHFAVTMLYGLYKWCFGRREPTMKQLLDQQRASFENAIRLNNEALIRSLTRGQGQLPADGVAAMQEASASARRLAAYGDALRIERTLRVESIRLQTLDQYASGMTPQQLTDLQAKATDMISISDSLSEATPDTIEQVVATQKTALSNLRTASEQLVTDMGAKIGASEKASLDNFKAISDRIVSEMGKPMPEVDAEGRRPIEPLEIESPVVPI